MSLPKKLSWDMAQTVWGQELDPVLANLLIQGQLLVDMPLVNGTTVISHKLGRKPLGWFLVAPKAAGTVFQAASQLNPTLQLTLISNAALTTSIWVF